MDKTISPKIIALTFGILTVSFLAAFYVVAWQEPTQAPPGGNVAAPLNIGNIGQSKAGGLILNTGGAEYGLIVDQGKSQFGGSLIFNPIVRPTSPGEGQIYFDQGDKKMYYYNGVEWIELAVTAPEECGVCMIYSSGTGGCVPLPAGTKDENCSALHYACNGAGSCTAPKSYSTFYCLPSEVGISWTAVCQNRGYDSCVRSSGTFGTCAFDDGNFSCSLPCSRGTSGDSTIYSCGECWNWVYD